MPQQIPHPGPDIPIFQERPELVYFFPLLLKSKVVKSEDSELALKNRGNKPRREYICMDGLNKRLRFNSVTAKTPVWFRSNGCLNFLSIIKSGGLTTLNYQFSIHRVTNQFIMLNTCYTAILSQQRIEFNRQYFTIVCDSV